jgi:hypothetical protein
METSNIGAPVTAELRDAVLKCASPEAGDIVRLCGLGGGMFMITCLKPTKGQSHNMRFTKDRATLFKVSRNGTKWPFDGPIGQSSPDVQAFVATFFRLLGTP